MNKSGQSNGQCFVFYKEKKNAQINLYMREHIDDICAFHVYKKKIIVLIGLTQYYQASLVNGN